MDPIYHLKLKHPFTAIVCGPSGSGKTKLVESILKDRNELIVNGRDLKVMWAYGEKNNSFNKYNFKYFQGLPNKKDLIKHKPDILVIDDLMAEMASDIDILNLFTKYSHHLKISVFLLIQNLFFKSKIMRTVSLNAKYIFLLKNPRDKSQIMHLARQLSPNNTKYIIESYIDATEKPYGYLKIDNTPDTPEDLRISTQFLLKGSKFSPIVYKEKNV